MTINDLLRALADELAVDVPDPLNQPLTLGLVWYDLARLAGVEPPADVLAVVDTPACHRIPAHAVRRGLPELKVLLEGLAQATRALRAAGFAGHP